MNASTNVFHGIFLLASTEYMDGCAQYVILPYSSCHCTSQVKGVMVSNIEKVTQRGDKLDDLGERAGL